MATLSPQSLTQGSGPSVCKVLGWLAYECLLKEGFAWRTPEYSVAEYALEEEQFDEDQDMYTTKAQVVAS